jgi:excisionase family DNA binding protein
MSAKLPDVFSTHSAARFCRVTPMTIIRWIEEGRIRAYKTPGGHRRIMRADLEDFCRTNGIPMQWEDRVDAGGTRRILIIDDDPAVVDAILDALFDDSRESKDDAYEVQHTDNLFDAGRLVSGFRPHVVFVDVNLPGIDPTRVAKSIRVDPAVAAARVVGIASDGTVKPLEDFDEVLNRPIHKKAVRRITDPLPRLPMPGKV